MLPLPLPQENPEFIKRAATPHNHRHLKARPAHARERTFQRHVDQSVEEVVKVRRKQCGGYLNQRSSVGRIGGPKEVVHAPTREMVSVDIGVGADVV